MAYQALGTKKVNKLRSKTGLGILSAYVRGGEGHTIRLHIEGGAVVLYRKGVLTHSQFRWKEIL